MIKQAVIKRVGNGRVDVQPVGSANVVKNVKVSEQISWDLLSVGTNVILDQLDQLPVVTHTIATTPKYYTPYASNYVGVINNALLADGTVALVGNLPVAPGVTVDGYDISLLGQAIVNLQSADTIARTGYTVLSHATHLVETIGPYDTTIMVRDALFADTEEIALSNTEGHIEYMVIDGTPTPTVDADGAPAWNYDVFRRSYSDPPGIEIGWAAATLINGLTQKGYIYMDGRGGSSKAPSINVVVIDDPDTHAKEHVAAIGNLSGLLDFDTNSYGIALGRLTTGDVYLSFNERNAQLRIANADIAGWAGVGSEAQEYYRIYGLFEDGHMPGDVRFGRDGGRLELWNETHKLAMLNGDTEIFTIDPSGARFQGMVWAGDIPGPQVGFGKDGSDAVIALRNEPGGPGFVATGSPSRIYVYTGNPPPLPNHWYYDSLANVAGFDGSFTVRDMIVEGQIQFSSIGSLKILDPDDPQRYGMVVPHGQYGYTVDAGGQQHISSVIAWAPLTLDTEPGLPGYIQTFTAGEVMFGRRRYRHFRVEAGANGRVGLFDGDNPRAYLDATGTGVFDGMLYARDREVVVGRKGNGIEVVTPSGSVDSVSRLISFVDDIQNFNFISGIWTSIDNVVSEAYEASVDRINITFGTYSNDATIGDRSDVRVLSNAAEDREARLRLQAAGDNGAAAQAIVDLYSMRGDDGAYSRIDLNAYATRFYSTTVAPAPTSGQTLANYTVSVPDGTTWNPSSYVGGLYMSTYMSGAWRPFAQAWGTTQRFGAATTNYSEIDGNGSLTFTGSARIAPRIKSATKSASPFTAFDDGLTTYYRINSASGAIVANLPDSNANKGLILTFKKINSGGSSITITPAGSDNIQGAGTYSLSTQWQYVSLKAADPHWEIVADG